MNVHFHGKRNPPPETTSAVETPVRELSAEERSLVRRMFWAESVIWICGIVIGIPILIFPIALGAVPGGPEGGHYGFGLMMLAGRVAAILLIPLAGIVAALIVRSSASARLRELRDSS